MCGEATQRGAIRQQDGKVKQAKRAPAWNGSRAGSTSQPDERCRLAVRREGHGVRCAGMHTQAQNPFVIVNRPLHVADLQMHRAGVRVVGQAKCRRRDAVWC